MELDTVRWVCSIPKSLCKPWCLGDIPFFFFFSTQLWPPLTVLCPFPVAAQHLFTLAMSKSVDQGVGTQGDACGTPTRSQGGGCRVQRRVESCGNHVQKNHTHSADKHADAHIRAHPRRHPAITATRCCHLISSGRAASPWNCAFFLNSHSIWKSSIRTWATNLLSLTIY